MAQLKTLLALVALIGIARAQLPFDIQSFLDESDGQGVKIDELLANVAPIDPAPTTQLLEGLVDLSKLIGGLLELGLGAEAVDPGLVNLVPGNSSAFNVVAAIFEFLKLFLKGIGNGFIEGNGLVTDSTVNSRGLKSGEVRDRGISNTANAQLGLVEAVTNLVQNGAAISSLFGQQVAAGPKDPDSFSNALAQFIVLLGYNFYNFDNELLLKYFVPMVRNLAIFFNFNFGQKITNLVANALLALYTVIAYIFGGAANGLGSQVPRFLALGARDGGASPFAPSDPFEIEEDPTYFPVLF